MADHEEESFASRKKGRIATTSSQSNELTARHKHPDETEAVYWKEKFETLKTDSKLKISKLEKDLQKSIDRQAKLEQYSFILESRLENKGEETTTTSSSSMEATKILQFYKNATSMEVKWSPNAPTDYVCTITNKKLSRGTKVIFQFPDSNTLEFIPKANPDMLPEQFRAHLSTEADAVSVILGEILTNLYTDEDEEEGEAA